MTLIQSAIYGLKSANDIVKSLIEVKTFTDTSAKVIELQTILINALASAAQAQAQQAALSEEIRLLKQKVVRHKTWQRQKQRYQLTTLGQSGIVTYALKAAMNQGEPPHWICAGCYEQGQRMILQPKSNPNYGFTLNCPGCLAEIQTGFKGAAPAPDYV